MKWDLIRREAPRELRVGNVNKAVVHAKAPCSGAALPDLLLFTLYKPHLHGFERNIGVRVFIGMSCGRHACTHGTHVVPCMRRQRNGHPTVNSSGSKVGSKHIRFQNRLAADGACFSLPLLTALPKLHGGDEPKKLNWGLLP